MKMMTNPTVDFIMTIYQESSPRDMQFLKEALKGMFSQTYTPIQYWIVCDPKTPQSLRQFITNFVHDECNNLPFTFFEHKMFGPELRGLENAYAISEFVNQSSAEYIAVTHSDDVSFPNRVEVQVDSFQKYPDAVISFAGWIFAKEDQKPKIQYLQQFANGFNVGYPSCWMIKKENFIYPIVKIPMKFDVDFMFEELLHAPMIMIAQPLLQYNYARSAENYSDAEDARTWDLVKQKYDCIRDDLYP